MKQKFLLLATGATAIKCRCNSKRYLAILLWSISLFAGAQTATMPDGGGTQNAPYKIAKLENLYWLSQNSAYWGANTYFVQTANIDATATSTWNSGAGFTPIGNGTSNFKGVYDGQKFSISNLFINSKLIGVGLFGSASGATLKNIDIVNCNITSTDEQIGALVGTCNGTTIENCFSSGSVTTKASRIGGLVGLSGNYSAIKYSKSTANVYSTGTGTWQIGGLVGLNNYSTISCCSASGAVSGQTYTGGLVGYSDKSGNSIDNSYATGAVSGTTTVGGFLGTNCVSVITNCYSTGKVSGTSSLGGFNGAYHSTSPGTINNSYWDISTSNQSTSCGGTGKSTAELKTQSSLSGWDFTNTWMMSPITGYPMLQTEPIPVTAGTLCKIYPAATRSAVTKLKLGGTIDARDFMTMRDSMPNLISVDLSEVKIASYTGTLGTNGTASQNYPANTIPASAFNWSKNNKLKLQNITIGNSITAIGAQAFYLCSALTTYSLPSSLTSIGDWAFQETSNASIVIPASVTLIGTGVFVGCKTSITVNEQNPNYSSLDGVLYDKTKATLLSCPTIKTGNFTIPSSVTSVSKYAFCKCSTITTVAIPKSVTSLGDCVFDKCAGLKTIYSYNPNRISLGVNVFQNTSSLSTTYVPAGSKANYASQWINVKEMDVANNPTNKALDFDGVDDYVSCANVSLNTFTIEAMIYLNALPTSGHGIIVSEINQSQGYKNFEFRVNNNGTLTLHTHNGTAYNYFSTTTQIKPKVWYHVAATSTGTLNKIFIDGTLDATTLAVSAVVSESTTKLQIGKRPDDSYSPAYWFNGRIDEVRIWNIARDPADIKANMYNPIANPASQNNLVAYYNFDQGMANGINTGITTLNNIKNNAANGTLNNFALAGTASNFVPRNGLTAYYPLDGNANDYSGNGNNAILMLNPSLANDRTEVASKAYYFNGMTQYVKVPDSVSKKGDPFTVSFWVKTKESRSNTTAWNRPTLFGNSTDGSASGDMQITSQRGRVGMFCGLSSPEKTDTTLVINDDKWHFIVCTYDNKTLKQYVDGVMTTEFAGATIGTNGVANYLMANNYATKVIANNFHEGTLDEVRIYNTVLSAADITDLNRQTMPTLSISTTNNSMAFDGAGDYASLSSPVTSPVTTAFTIEYWMKTTQKGSVSTSSSYWYNGTGIVDAEFSNILNDFGTSLLGDKLCFGVGNPDVSIQSSSVVNTGQWVHVAATWQSTGEMKLYINGALESSLTGVSNVNRSVSAIRLGSLQTGQNTYFTGQLDEVRIWSTARTQADIVASMNKSITAKTDGLLVNYTFDKGVANGANTTTLTDESGNTKTYNASLNMALSAGNSTSNYTYGAPLTYPTATSTLTLAQTLGSEGVARVTSTTTWTATSSEPWLTLIPSTATGNGLLTIRAATANPLSTTRTATVTVSAAGTTSQTITVTQAAGDATLSVSTTNNALAFDGSDDYVSIADNNNLDFTNNFTIEAWINPKKFEDMLGIVSKYITNDSKGYVLRLSGKEGKLHFCGGTTVNNVLKIGTWCHVAAVYSNGIPQLYINGEEQPLNIVPQNILANTDFVAIGRDYDGRYFQGQIDEVRLWNTVRSQTDIIASMNQSLSSGTDLIASYSFNQGVPYGNNTSVTSLVNSLSGGASATHEGFVMTGASSNIVPGAPLQNTSTTSTLALDKAAGSTGYASIASNSSWTATASASWLNVTPGSGSNNGELKIVAATANPTTAARNATVVITSGTNKHTTTVTQAAGEAILAVSTTNNALDFDGVDDKVDCTHSTNFDFSNNQTFTVEAWINPRLNSSWSSIIANDSWVANKGFLLAVNNNVLFFALGQESLSKTITLDNWMHVAAVYDKKFASLYINGDLVASKTFTNSFVFPSEGSKMLIGARNENYLNGNLTDYFKGKIDEVRIWNIARPQDSIVANMNKSLPLRSNLVANYNFNQGIANGVNPNEKTLTSLSGGINGTLSSTFALSGSTSNWTTGAPLNYTTDPAKIAVAHQATTAYAEVTANTAVTATSDNTWLTPTVNPANGSLALAASANPTTNKRTATVTLTSGTLNEKITVEQDGIPADDKSVDRCVMNTTGAAENYVEVPANPTAYNFADNNCTFEFWFKASDLNSRRELFNWKSSNSDDFGLFVNTNKQLQVFLSTSGTNYLSATANTIEANKWYHVAIVCAGTNLKVYLNGVAVIDKEISNQVALANLKNTIIKLGINTPTGDCKEAFLGKFDEFRIWKTARTDVEIRDNMHYRLDAQDSLVGLFHFDEATGNELFDYSASNNHASLKGGVNRAVSNAQITPLFVNTNVISSCQILGWWNLMPLADKYVIELSDKANFDNATDTTLTRKNEVSINSLWFFSKLKPNTTYYIRVHGEREKDGKVGDTVITSATTLPLPTFTVTQPTTASLGSITVTSPTSGVTYGTSNDSTSASNPITGLKRGAYPVYVKYKDDKTCIVKAADSARINAKPLTATAEVETTKVYDGEVNAKVNSSALKNKESNDDVTVSATATYSDVLVGTSKTITVKYSISGTNKDNYIAPKDSVISVGVVTQRKLTIDASISKVYDGTTDAMNAVKITALKDTVKGDKVSVMINSAVYNDNNVDKANTATLKLSLSGEKAGQYTINDTTISALITKAPLTVKADDITIFKGTSLPKLTYTYSGFVPGDDSAMIDTKPKFTPPNDYSIANPYTLTIAGASDNNYDIIHVNGVLTVTNKKVPTIDRTKLPGTITYGDGIGGTKFVITAQDENKATLAGSFAYINGSDTINNKALEAKQYNLRIKFTPTNKADYDTVSFAYSLEVKPASLTITVKDTTFEYGTTPQFKYTVSTPFVNKETENVLSGVAQYQYTTNPPVGPHTVTMSGLSASNYAITFNPGTLIVTPATLTVTAPHIVIVQGESLPTYQLKYDGFKYKDTIASLTMTPVITITDSTTVGITILTPTGGQSINYEFNYVSDSLIVKKATLSVDSSEVTFAAASQLKDSVRVRANTKWNFAPTSNSWLTVTRSKDSILYFVAEANMVNKPRELSVMLSTVGGFASQTITVVQAAAILDSTVFTKLADSVNKTVKAASIGTGHLQYTAQNTTALVDALKALRTQLANNSTQAQVNSTSKQLSDSIASYLDKQIKVNFSALSDFIGNDTVWLKTIAVGTLPCQYDSAKKAAFVETLNVAKSIINKQAITQDSVTKQIIALNNARQALADSKVGEATKTNLTAAIDSANKCLNLLAADYPTASFDALKQITKQATFVSNNECATPQAVDSAAAQTNRAIAKFLASKLYRIHTDVQSWSLGYNKDNKTINVESNDQWTASSNSDWLHVSLSGTDFTAASTTAQGNRNSSISFIAASNTTRQARTAKITFVCGNQLTSIEVTQLAIKFELTANSIQWAAVPVASTTIISSEKQWTASTDAQWLRVALSNSGFEAASSTVSGNANQLTSLWILGQNNTSTSARTAIIRILVEGLETQEISVRQEAAATLLQVSIAKRIIPATATNNAFEVRANSNWTATSSNAEWLGVSLSGGDFAQASGTLSFANASATNTQLWFAAATNTSQSERTAELQFVCGTETRILSIVQDAPITTVQPSDMKIVAGQEEPKFMFASAFKYLGNAPIEYKVQSLNPSIANIAPIEGGIQLVQGNTGSTSITIEATTAYGTFAKVSISVNAQSGACMEVATEVTSPQCAGVKSGRIVVTPKSSAPPFYYSWDNKSTDSIAEGLDAGVYSVVINDSRGCTVVKAFTLAKGDSITVNQAIVPAKCGAKGGELSLSVTGGTQPYTYRWVDTSSTQSSLQNIKAGNYTVIVSDKKACITPKTIRVPNENEPTISFDTIKQSPCGKHLGAIYPKVEGQYDSVLWSNGSRNLLQTGLAPQLYKLTVFAGKCSVSNSVAVPSPKMTQPEIALVTIDSAFTNPLVVWLRDKDTSAVAYYDIYRDGRFIVRKNYRDYSVYHDMDKSINLKSQPYSYQIKAINACNEETPLSQAISTMYLQAYDSRNVSGAVELNWSAYSSGLKINKYSIYRVNGNEKTLVNVVENKDKFTDETPGVKPRYYVMLNLNDTLLVSQLKTDSGPFSQSFSNMSEATLVDLHDTKQDINTEISLVPNPANEVVTISFGKKAQTATVTLVDLLGHELFSAQATESLTIDCSGYTAGMYLIRVTINEEITVHSLIIE